MNTFQSLNRSGGKLEGGQWLLFGGGFPVRGQGWGACTVRSNAS